MEWPEWDPVVALAKTERLSGPIPACAAFVETRDQVMSPLRLAPSTAARRPVLHGHGLEIPMAFWSATCAMGTSHCSDASIPMGARNGHDRNQHQRTPGHAGTSKVAGTVKPLQRISEDDFLPCRVCRLDRGLLMGALQGRRSEAPVGVAQARSLEVPGIPT